MSNKLLNLPVELRALPQWCITPGTNVDKAPRTVSGGPASSIDPTTWTDFDTARGAAESRGWRVGNVLDAADPFTVIDLDIKDATTHPDQPELWTTPEDLERFESIARIFDSYT